MWFFLLCKRYLFNRVPGTLEHGPGAGARGRLSLSLSGSRRRAASRSLALALLAFGGCAFPPVSLLTSRPGRRLPVQSLARSRSRPGFLTRFSTLPGRVEEEEEEEEEESLFRADAVN